MIERGTRKALRRRLATVPKAIAPSADQAKSTQVFRSEDTCRPELRCWSDLPPPVVDYAFTAALAANRASYFVTYSFRELHPPEETAQKILNLTLARVEESRLGRQYQKRRLRDRRTLSLRNLQRRPSSGAFHAHELVFLCPTECPERYFELLECAFAASIADCMFLPHRCGALRRQIGTPPIHEHTIKFWKDRWQQRLLSQPTQSDRLLEWRPVTDLTGALGYIRRENTAESHSRGWSR